MIHEVDYSLLCTLTTRYVFVMLYISKCQSCHLFERSIHPRLVEDLSEFDIVFYKSNCEKQTHIKHFPAFVLYDRQKNTQVEYRGVLKFAEMGKFLRDQIMKCTDARIVPYRRSGGRVEEGATVPDHPTASLAATTTTPVELDVFSFDDLKERAQKTDKAFIVLYYADWCSQCTLFKPTFNAFAAQSDGAIVGVFKDNGKYTAELFKAEGVVAVPTVKIYYNHETHERKGGMTLDALREFVKSRTKTLQSAHHTASCSGSSGAASGATSQPPPEHPSGSPWDHPRVRSIAHQWQDEIQRMRDDGCVVLYYAPSCPFSEKVRPIFHEVAENEAYLKVAVVNVSELRPEERATLAQEEITAVPTIVMYTKYTSFVFDGENDVQSIGRFIKHRMEQQQQTSNDRRGMLQIQGGGFLKAKSIHSQSLFLFPDNNGMHAQDSRPPVH